MSIASDDNVVVAFDALLVQSTDSGPSCDEFATIAFISVQLTGFVIHVINSMQIIETKQNQKCTS